MFNSCNFCRRFAGPKVLVLFTLLPVIVLPCAAQQLGEVTMEMISGATLAGTIEKIEPTGLVVGKGIPLDCQIDQIASIKTRHVENPRGTSKVQIRLIGGGVINADRLEIADDEIQIAFMDRKADVALDVVQAVVWRMTDKTDDQVRARSSEVDKVVVKTDSGERLVEGVLEGVDETHVKIKYRGESRKIAKSKVNALILADLQMPEPEGVMAAVTTKQRWIVVGAIQNLDDGFLHLAPVAGRPISIQVDDIVSVKIQSDRVVYLSDLEPLEVQQKPVFSVPRSWRRDKSVEGNPLTLKDPASGEVVVYSKGLGTQSFTALTFENKDGFDLFHATIGIDSETRGNGDCEMEIRGDGIQLWSRRVRGADKPATISIDITGMKQIVLRVNVGEQFDLADHANWCEARFLKSK